MLIPDQFPEGDSKGEKLIFYKFRNENSAKNYKVLHSLFISKHLTTVSGEVDFLVLAPGLGVFCLEVKHGSVELKGGKWIFQDRHGNKSEKLKSPFRQVNDTMHSLRNMILERVKHKPQLHDRIKKLLFGWGVMFTSMDEFWDYGAEAETWQIFTKGALSIPISEYVQALSKGWHNKSRDYAFYNPDSSRPTEKDCELLVQILRGDFAHNYSRINEIIDGEKLIHEYTKEQFEFLDFTRYNPRCLITGGAGTGKTLMALELASQKVIEGKRVALFCYNKLLGDKLKTDLSRLPAGYNDSFYAGTLHRFLLSGTSIQLPEKKEEYSEFFENTLPLQFIIDHDFPLDEKFDCLIIDEAQDLLQDNYLEVFNSILKGGIRDGEWIMFGDFHDQSIYNKSAIDTLAALPARASYANSAPLKINCRNTQKIALQNSYLTGAGFYKPSAILEGDAVEQFFPAKQNITGKVEEIIQQLSDDGVPLKNITILTGKAWHRSTISGSDTLRELFGKGLTCYSIHAFKGLENSVVILTDFDDLTSNDALKLLYIGISRARMKLFIVLDKSLENDYKYLLVKNTNT